MELVNFSQELSSGFICRIDRKVQSLQRQWALQVTDGPNDSTLVLKQKLHMVMEFMLHVVYRLLCAVRR
jgi:hypothetical protein